MKSNLKTASKLTASLALAASVFVAPNAMAWGKIVFDPTNFSSANLMNYYQLIKQVAEAKRHTEQFVDMLSNEFPLADAEVVRNSVEMYTSLREMSSAVDSLQQGFAASRHGDWRSYIMDITRRASNGNNSAKVLMEKAYDADARMRKADAAYRSVMGKLPNVKGVTEAAQATANAVGVVIQQNQAALGLMSAQARDAAMTRSEMTAKQKNSDESLKKFRDESTAAFEAMKQMKVKAN